MPSQLDESLHSPVQSAAPNPIAETSSVWNRIADLAAESTDPQRVSRYFEQFFQLNPNFSTRLENDPDRLRWLACVFTLSAFLSDEVIRHPEWIFEAGDLLRPYSAADFEARLISFLSGRSAAALDFALFRRKELLRIAIRDGLTIAPVPELTTEISNLADAILSCALEAVMKETEARYGFPQTRGANGEIMPAHFGILALGKLGGCELNYSSDIDLMFLYSGNGQTTGPHPITNREFFKKVANQLTNLLSAYTQAGVCYRVDLRLRPEGSLGEVCVSLEGMKDYYAQRARDWELQMLIKARVAAGDKALGQEFLDAVEPLIYSTTLDFTAIETMSATRERIGEKLARKRLREDQLDVKLTRGGIRDIEFLVQCLQRLHGARESSVRHGGTLFALSGLFEKDLLSEGEYARLKDAYQFLRSLEHRLQLEDDRQTHTLPADPHGLERVARRMPPLTKSSLPVISGAQLLQILNQHLENVQVIYERIVHAQRPLYYKPFEAAIPLSFSLPTPTSETPKVDISSSLLAPVESLSPVLAARARGRNFLRNESALSGFAEALEKEPYYLRLLEERIQLADHTLHILDSGPYLAEQLIRDLHLIDEIQRAIEIPAARPAFEALAWPLSDIEALRRFFRREMFRILAGSICLAEPVFQTLDRTSSLAEFLIARAYRIALEQALSHARAHAMPVKPFAEPQNEMMVIALGRLGMREFDLGSDADLLFIIPNSESSRQRFWTRVAERMVEILTAYNGDGPILSIDTRLRPNGREGMLVQTESNYVDYFSGHAEAWEGIAYMKARAVAGDSERATIFLTELQQVDWRRYGQSGRSRQDLRQMRLRLQREQGASTPLKAAEGGYYDADFILMYLRLKGAGLFFKSLNTPERIDIVEKMGHLERADAEFLLDAATFYRGLDHALRISLGRTAERLPSSPQHREMVAGLLQLWTRQPVNAATLAADLETLQSEMRKLFDRIFH
jgi:[glutamine synthetase] adenylyltransferase / [glutamine synthetase]-adenylyl-L-tyrosine phosphorylase